MQKLVNVHKEKVEQREIVFKRDAVPYLEKWIQKYGETEKEKVQKLAEVMSIQTEIMINMHDDLNIGFTEQYKKLRNITDPIIVKQLNEE